MDVLSNSDNANRDRSRRGERSRYSDDDSTGGDRDRSRDRESSGINKRIIVRNLPADYCWQDLKDVFRRLIGHVDYVYIYNKKNGTFGVVEFKNAKDVASAIERMNGHNIYGNNITVEKDVGTEDYEIVQPVKKRRSRKKNRDDDIFMNSRGYGGGGGRGGSGERGGGGRRGGSVNMSNYDMPYNTYGLSASFLESLGIKGPLHTKVFITNLDYDVGPKKVKQIFKLAGKIVNLDLSIDSDGNSRGYGIIEYEHPVEAVQAVSLFDNQLLYDRRMTVRLDRMADITETFKLPEGLAGIGMGLGPNGEPLRNVAQNLPNQRNNQNNINASNNNINNNNNMNMNMNMHMNQNSIPGPVEAPPIVDTSYEIMGLKNMGLLSASGVVMSGAMGNTGMFANILANTNNSSYNTLSGSVSGVGGGGGGVGSGVGDGFTGSINFNNTNSRNDYDSGSQNASRGYTTQQDDFQQRSSQSQNFQSNDNKNRDENVSDTIVIRNLPTTCTWQTLRDKFSDIGEVKFAEIRGQGCGLVRFVKERDAELAIKLMDGARLDGCTVEVLLF